LWIFKDCCEIFPLFQYSSLKCSSLKQFVIYCCTLLILSFILQVLYVLYKVPSRACKCIKKVRCSRQIRVNNLYVYRRAKSLITRVTVKFILPAHDLSRCLTDFVKLFSRKLKLKKRQVSLCFFGNNQLLFRICIILLFKIHEY
jgi:hypothetical protein